MIRPSTLCVTLLLTALCAETSAQSRCALPVSAYATDDAGAPIAGSIDLELNFYVDSAPDATPVECRTFSAVPVTNGWLRVDIDACTDPIPDDCGTMPITRLLAASEGMWVAILADGTELGPRVAVGSVPFAVEASNSAALGGLAVDAFERAGNLDAHSADPDAHHSSTSDGIAITPLSVQLGDTRIEPGEVDLGPAADDTLTSSIVQTLTGGGEADALHTHAGSGHAVGGIACYQVMGSTTCGEGFTLVSEGSMMYVGGSDVHCIATDRLTPSGSRAVPCVGLTNIGCDPTSWTVDDADFVCGTCCGAPVTEP